MAKTLKLVCDGRRTSRGSRGFAVVAGYDHDPRGRALPRMRFGRREEDRIPVQGATDVLEVAELFGYAGPHAVDGQSIAAAQAYLDAHVGDVIADPGCF